MLSKSSIGKTMTYFINQYPKLIAVLKDPRLELDNNLIENTIRPGNRKEELPFLWIT
ncbi:MAG: transposase [Flavobacteriaceae bacterium]|nr:transposase [Flavobacteriaceae bacterium]